MSPDKRTDAAFAVLFGDMAPLDVTDTIAPDGTRDIVFMKPTDSDPGAWSSVSLKDLDALPEYDGKALPQEQRTP